MVLGQLDVLMQRLEWNLTLTPYIVINVMDNRPNLKKLKI